MPPSSVPLLCLLLAAPAPALVTKAGGYCGSDTPLSTPYFAPFHKKVEATWGCQAASPPGDEKSQVHVVRLIGVQEEVFLDVNGTAPLSLVLVSLVPTTWHLTALPSTPSILVSMNSIVLDTVTGQEVPSRETLFTSPTKTANIALGKFGHINTFTTVDKEANRIFITDPPDLTPNPPCVGQTRQPSRSVLAYQLVRQSSYGCYHPEAAGLLPNDVHVIDLRSAATPPSVRSRRDTETLPEVVVELGPEVSESESPLYRNLTLVLKSERPVRWMMKSTGIQGRLVVTAGENPVENLSVGSSQLLDIQHTEMPDQFDGLMKEVTSQYGMPLSYLRVHHANLLEMRIPPRSKRELANLWEEREGSVDTSRNNGIKIKSMEERIHDAAVMIESSLSKKCDQATKEMSVSVPVSLLSQLGVTHLTFNDASCKAEITGDLWKLSSHSTMCGSTVLQQSSLPMFRNNLHIQFESGELAGQRTKIPLICKFQPCVPGLCYTEPEQDPDLDPDYPETDLEAEEMYNLAVKLSNPGEGQSSLLNTRSDSGVVGLGDTLAVYTDINAVPYLALAIEQCWLSNSSRLQSHSREEDIRLITSGCPAREDVSLTWDLTSSNSAFTFHVTESMSQHSQLWLYCRMGLCSGTPAGVSGNIHRCLEPEPRCKAGTQHRESALQQVTVRGPLKVLPHPRTSSDEEFFQQQPGIQEEREEESSAQPSSRTLVEVSVEVAVAISLASFLVGAATTGVLWFLHSQAIRAKSVREVQLRSMLAREGSELQPMTGVTSVPGTCHASRTEGVTVGDHNGNCPACPLVVSS